MVSGLLFYLSISGFCLGVFLRSIFDFPKEAIVLLLVISFVFGVLWRRKSGAFSSPYFVMSVALLCIAIGLFRVEVTTWHQSAFTDLENQNAMIEGIVVREPDVRTTSQLLYVKDTERNELILVIADAFEKVSYGDVVQVEGTVEVPESFEADLGRTFNYPGYLRARGVTHELSFAKVKVVAHGEGNWFLAKLFIFKNAFMHSLERAVPEPAAGLGEGLLLGAKRAIGADLEDVFRRTGIIHIVVLSGFNVMIVAEAIMRLLAFFFKPRTRTIIGGVALLSFALMVGLSATVLRASIMAVLVLIARATGRTTAAARSLFFAGAVMVMFNPYLVAFDPGFQLSFLATLGLILLAPFIEQRLHLVPTKFQIREFITATIAAQIAVLPLLLYLMGQFSVVAVLVNALVLPMVPVAMLFSFITGIVGMALPPLALIFGFFTNLSLIYIIAIASLFSSLPFAAFLIPAFPFWVAVLAYGALAYIYWRLAFVSKSKNIGKGVEEDFSDWQIVSLESFETEIKLSAGVRSTPADSFPFR